DTVGSSVSATDRLSMLKPRPLNRPATRARTPKSFSTRTEIVCRMSMRPMPREDLHDLVLAGELQLLETLLFDFFVGGEIVLLLIGAELLLEAHVLLVVAPQLGIPFEQSLYELLVFGLHRHPHAEERS